MKVQFNTEYIIPPVGLSFCNSRDRQEESIAVSGVDRETLKTGPISFALLCRNLVHIMYRVSGHFILALSEPFVISGKFGSWFINWSTENTCIFFQINEQRLDLPLFCINWKRSSRNSFLFGSSLISYNWKRENILDVNEIQTVYFSHYKMSYVRYKLNVQ